MASSFSIQEPYAVAALPSNGAFKLAEVAYETRSRKRKRSSEVVVGIDGDAANIYNVRPNTATSIVLPC